MKFDVRKPHAETVEVRGGVGPEEITGAVVPPVFQSTTYVQPYVGSEQAHTYSRASNPTVTALEEALAQIEGVRYGSAFTTGMAAITVLALSIVKAGDHVVCSDVVYGGTSRLLEGLLSGLGVESTFVDSSEPEQVAAALRPSTRLVLLETPANPTLKLTDVGAVAELLSGRSRRSDRDVVLAVDNTFLTAALQRTVPLGADVVVYSTTKYIEGHNTTVGGALLTDDLALKERFDLVRKTTGTIQSPWDAWLTLKGLKTLSLRLRRHSETALEVARWLDANPAVTRVAFPFLETFPQVELARRQQVAGGGMLAFEVEGGTPVAVEMMRRLRLCLLAENLGAAETLVTHPTTMTHGDLDPDERRRRGISDGLIRLSVGLEHPADIIADLEQALTGAATGALRTNETSYANERRGGERA